MFHMEFTGDFITADRRDVVNIFSDRFADIWADVYILVKR